MKPQPLTRKHRALRLTLRAALAQIVAFSAYSASGTALAEERKDGAPPAQEHQLKEITVTAGKVEATEQETPISMTVVTGEDLERSSATGTSDLVMQVPNMHMTKAGQHSDASFFSMRGVTPFMEGEQPVGFFVDGVYQNSIDINLLDVDRIEVLRGPQSTLYGRNTEAGVVNIVTRDPEPFNEGMVTAGLENYNQKKIGAIVGGPLGNQEWSYRAAVQWLGSDGYFTREPGNVDDVDKTNDLNGRVKVRWHPNAAWDVVATYEGQRYRDGSTGFSYLSQLYSDPHKVFSDFIGSADSDIQTGSLRAVYKGSAFTVTSITAFGSEDKKNAQDIDFTMADQARLHTHIDTSRFTQELRLNSPDSADRFRWVAGLYYFDQTAHNNVDVDIRSFYVDSTRTRTDTKNSAAFGQATWKLADKLELTAGLRYDHETKNVDNRRSYSALFPSYTSGADLTFDAWLPKIALQYQAAPNLLTYASFAKGYKAGGFNNLAPQGEETFDAEYTKNYEIGLKYLSPDKRLKANLSLFWIDWTNQQVEQAILAQSIVSNAGKSVSRGVEVELAWEATNALLLRASAGWNDAHFVEYRDGDKDYADKRPPNAPAYTYTLSADYDFGDGIYARADWLGSGHFFFDAANTRKQEHYGILNLRAGTRFKKDYEFSVWLKNAFDKVYATRAFDAGDGYYAGTAGDPRTFGMTLTAWW